MPTTYTRKRPRTPRMPTIVYASISIPMFSPRLLIFVERLLNMLSVWLNR